MTCPIGCLELAIDGRVSFVNDILKSVFGPSKDDEDAKKLAEQKPDPATAAKQLMGYLKRRQKDDNRRKSKPPKKPRAGGAADG